MTYWCADMPDEQDHQLEQANREVEARLAPLMARLSRIEEYVDELKNEHRNIKNEVLTMQDENLHLHMALNREHKKVPH